MIGVGVIGLGFMGGTHIAAYVAAARAGYPCRLVAVCDADPERRSGKLPGTGNMQTGAASFDAKDVRGHDCIESMLADADVQLVSICTPTSTHVDLAIAALRAGKHVLVEKPVATSTEPIRKLREAARASKTFIMPAMCMRFWPAWSWLKDAIDQKKFGALRSLNLQRVGSIPTWSKWFADVELSGGAIIDLHIHDADFVRYCLGRPAAVTSSGHVNHVSTIYHFDDPSLHVTAQGGWLSAGTPFRMRYIAEFEGATADFDIARPQQLLLNQDRKSAPVDVGALNGYDVEVRHLLDAINCSRPVPDGKPPAGTAGLQATLDDAIDVAIMLETEQYAAECGRRVQIMWGVEEPPGH